MSNHDEPARHFAGEVSGWVRRWAGLVPPGGEVVDIAAGGGRHSRLFLDRGHPVTAVDIRLDGLAALAEHAGLTLLQADLEAAPWPLTGRRFAGVVVTDYLWRPLLPLLVRAVAPGGALIYATFAEGNERLGRPRNPDFLLRPGELLEAVRGDLLVRAYEHGPETHPRPAVRQRIAAIRVAP